MANLSERLRDLADEGELIHLYPHDLLCRRLREAATILDRLQSLSDQNRLTGGWRDIESAPKEDRFLVFGGVSNSDLGGGDPVQVTMVERYQDDYRPERFNVCDTCYYSVWIEKPTHWQPLPSPPLPLPGGEEKR